MASFYMPDDWRDLAEKIAATCGGQVIERPHANAVEVHGQRLVVTREMIRAHLGAWAAAKGMKGIGVSDATYLERHAWETLKRNAAGTLKENETSLEVQGETEVGQEPKRGGCFTTAVVAAFLITMALLALVTRS